MSWVISAYGMNGDPKYMDAYDLLTNATNQYDLNLVRRRGACSPHVCDDLENVCVWQLNLKITTPEDDNFSDDELTFLPYFTYAISTGAVSRQLPTTSSLASCSTPKCSRYGGVPVCKSVFAGHAQMFRRCSRPCARASIARGTRRCSTSARTSGRLCTSPSRAALPTRRRWTAW